MAAARNRIPARAPNDISPNLAIYKPSPVDYCCYDALWDLFTLNPEFISQINSNLKAWTSFTALSWAVSLISTVLNAPVFLRLAIRSATEFGLNAIPVKFSVLPSLVMVSSQTASVLLMVSATRFSRSTGPDCADFSSSMTLTRRSYMSAFFLLASYLALTSASLWFSRTAFCRFFSSTSCSRCTHTWASPINTASAPAKIKPRMRVLDPSPPPVVATVLARRPPPRVVFFGTPSRLMRIIGLQSSSGPGPPQPRAVPGSVPICRVPENQPAEQCVETGSALPPARRIPAAELPPGPEHVTIRPPGKCVQCARRTPWPERSQTSSEFRAR